MKKRKSSPITSSFPVLYNNTMKTPEEYSKHWWWLVLCAIIFAAIGSLFSMVFPRQYRSSVDLQILFETNREMNWTDKYMLSFTEEIGSIMDKAEMNAAVIQQLNIRGFSIDQQQMERYTTRELRFYGWKMIVTTNDPQLTEAVLEEWRTIVASAIQQDLESGQQAQQQHIQAAAWIPCLQQLPVEPVHPICSPDNASSISTLYHQAYHAYQNSQASIRYLSSYPPSYTIEFLEQKPVTSVQRVPQPIAIAAGLLLGILIGTITIQHPWTSHLRWKRGEA